MTKSKKSTSIFFALLGEALQFVLSLNFLQKIVKFNLMKKSVILLILSFLFCEVLINISIDPCPFHSFEPIHFSKSKLLVHSCTCIFYSLFFSPLPLFNLFLYFSGETIKNQESSFISVFSIEIFHPPQ